MVTETHQNVTLPFLEKRNYLHGTTLFKYLSSFVPSNVGTCLRIFRQIRTNAILVGPLQKVDDPVARIDWIEDGNAQALAVEPLPIQRPIKRDRYDESLVSSVCYAEGLHVYLKGRPPFDAIATAVPMFKFILELNGHSPALGGQWMFTRLDSIASVTLAEKMELRLISIRHRSVAKAELGVAGARCAILYFSWVPLSHLELES